jgi:hypothetical protein
MRTCNKIWVWVWVCLGGVCLCGAVFCGAWWHLFTTVICAVMALTFWDECNQRRDGRDEL